MSFLQALDLFFRRFDGDELCSSLDEFLSGVAAGVAEAADDNVAGNFVDAFLHAASPEWVRDFNFDDEGGDYGKHIDRGGDAEDHDEHVEDAKGRMVRGLDDLSVADAGDGDDGHIERLQEADGVTAEEKVADYAEGDEAEEESSGEEEAFLRGHPRRHSSMRFATRPLHPVWWLAPRPMPVSPW